MCSATQAADTGWAGGVTGSALREAQRKIGFLRREIHIFVSNADFISFEEMLIRCNAKCNPHLAHNVASGLPRIRQDAVHPPTDA